MAMWHSIRRCTLCQVFESRGACSLRPLAQGLRRVSGESVARCGGMGPWVVPWAAVGSAMESMRMRCKSKSKSKMPLALHVKPF